MSSTMASSSRPAPGPDSVLAVYGPTASGKTALAEVLRSRLGVTVISADSAAVYRDVPLLTAAPAYPAELVGVVAGCDDVSVGWYQREAHAAIDRSARPLVAGGTGLWFRAAISALELPPPPEPGARERWQSAYDELGAEAAHALLAERDAGAAARVHPNDRRRVVRALELAEAGSSLAPAADRLWAEDTRLPTTVVGLDVPLDELDRRIDARTREMVERGVVEEAKRAWEQPLSHTARKILGLEEFATLPLDEALESVVAATRRLARYQRKWLARLSAAARLDGRRHADDLADELVSLERTRKRLPRR
jgi:tRNA dimethylallyltransferase